MGLLAFQPHSHMGVLKRGDPQNHVSQYTTSLILDDLGYPHFRKAQHVSNDNAGYDFTGGYPSQFLGSHPKLAENSNLRDWDPRQAVGMSAAPQLRHVATIRTGPTIYDLPSRHPSP